MSSHFFKKNLDGEWENLYKKILHQISDRWESHVRSYDRLPEYAKQQIVNDGMLRALTCLLPLAKELQNDESLHHLMPWQHYGVITLFLMDWEKEATHGFMTILRSREKENAYRVYLHDENRGYAERPIETIESVALGEIRSLIQARLRARVPVTRSTSG